MSGMAGSWDIGCKGISLISLKIVLFWDEIDFGLIVHILKLCLEGRII